MNSFSVAVIKMLLTSLCAISIALSCFLIVLIFDMWSQQGIPPFENVKFSVCLFFSILLLFVITGCFKFLMDICIDNRKEIKDQIRKQYERKEPGLTDNSH